MAVIVIVLVGLIAWLFLNSSGGTGRACTVCCGGGNVKLDATGILPYAQTAGFTGGDLITAVSIALAESGGNTEAEGDKDSSGTFTSLGLWQIHFTVHPEFDATQLFDPQYNANCAFNLYQRRGNDFTDWSTYNGGQYQAFMGDVQAAVGG